MAANRWKWCYTVLIFLFLFLTTTYAQQDDLELWNGVTAEYKQSKKLDFDLETQIRWDQNISHVSTYLAQIGATYEPFKDFDVGAYYRYYTIFDEDRTSHSHRYHVDLKYTFEFDRTEFYFRTRYQSRYKDINTSEEGGIAENVNRNKLKLSYEVIKKDLEVAVSYETFYAIGYFDEQGFTKDRIGFEASYRLTKKYDIEIFYLIDDTWITQNRDGQTFILGTGFSIELN